MQLQQLLSNRKSNVALKIFIIILAVIVAALFSSCATEKKRMRICQECPVKTKDSIRETERIVVKDTSIYITQQGPTVLIESPCDSLGMLKRWEIKKKTNGIIATIKSDGKSITADCDADSLRTVVKNLVKERDTFKSHSETKTIEKFKPETWWQVTYRWWFWISVVVIILFLSLKFGGKIARIYLSKLK